MDFISTGTEILKQENVLTPRQKDIIDTEKEMLKSPFDRNTGNRQISRRMDTHGIIVVERFATFHYY